MTAPSTAPSIGANHPAARAFHLLNEIAQTGIWLEDISDLDLTHDAGTAIREKCTLAMEHVGALNVLLERQERVIEEQRIESVRLERSNRWQEVAWLRVTEKNSELVQAFLTLTRQLDEAHEVIQLTRESPRVAAEA